MRRLVDNVVRPTLVACPLLLALLIARGARADEPSAADVASARRLGFEGITLADKGNCAVAVDKLARAEKLFHAPTTLGRLGECQVQLGKLVEGTENLGRAAREDLPATAPQAFVQARARARKVLAATTPKLARAKISVKAPPEANVSVTVDGVVVPPANLGEDRALDPGAHLVKASAHGFLEASTTLHLREGGSEEVVLTLAVDPAAPVIAAHTVTATRPPGPTEYSASPSGGSPNRTAAFLMLGVGIASVGAGAAFGLSALTQRNSLSKECPNNACAASRRSDLDAAKRAGTVSTVAFGVGAVAVLVGTVLYLTAKSPSLPVPPSASGAGATPYADGTTIGVAGAF